MCGDNGPGDGGMDEKRAEATVIRLKAMLEDNAMVGVPEVVKLIRQLSARVDSLTGDELAEIIGSDQTVTARILDAAKRMHYNPGGVEITALSQAVFVIGFKKIRNLAFSLLLLENAQNQMTPAEQREAASVALYSGLMARQIAQQRGDADPEEAFICASLRNYGRLLLTTFMIEEYREALDLTAQFNNDEAFRRVFGLTPLELGFQLLKSYHLPESILNTLKECPPQKIDEVARMEKGELVVLAEFSVRFCELAVDPTVEETSFDEQSRTLFAQFREQIGLDDHSLFGLLDDVDERLGEMNKRHGLKTLTRNRAAMKKSRRRSREEIEAEAAAVLAERDQPPTAEPVAEAGSASAAKPPGAPPREEAAHAAAGSPGGDELRVRRDGAGEGPDAFNDLLGEIVTAKAEAADAEAPAFSFPDEVVALMELIMGGEVTLDAVYTRTVEIIGNGLNASNVILAVDDGGGSFQITHAHGSFAQSLCDHARLDSRHKDIFTLATQRREDVWIEDARQERIQAYLPSWLTGARDVGSLVVLPLVAQRRVFGLIGAFSPRKSGIEVAGANRKPLQTLRTALAHAQRLGAS